MKKEPTVATHLQSREAILEKMHKNQIRQIPVLDESRRVIRLELLDELTTIPEKDNWVVLMAGGLGTRLGTLTEDKPKPLIPVGSKPILETILENFIEYGFKKFYFSVNYKAEMIRAHFGSGEKWGVTIRYLHEEKKMGTAGPLSLLPEPFTKPILVMNGDLLTKVNFQQLLDFHREQKCEATMCVREFDFQVPYGVVKLNRQKITAIDEKPVQRFFVNAGIYVLEPLAIASVPKSEPSDMPSLFEHLIRENRPTAAFPIREYWMDIGRTTDLERANAEFVFEFKSRADR
jgi:NDP-sugar pyrophosphorylase family protein